MNREHYHDPTAERALQNIKREGRKQLVIQIIKLVARLGGYKIKKIEFFAR